MVDQVGLGNFQAIKDDIEPCIRSSEELTTHLLELNHHDYKHDNCEAKINYSDCIPQHQGRFLFH